MGQSSSLLPCISPAPAEADKSGRSAHKRTRKPTQDAHTSRRPEEFTNGTDGPCWFFRLWSVPRLVELPPAVFTHMSDSLVAVTFSHTSDSHVCLTTKLLNAIEQARDQAEAEWGDVVWLLQPYQAPLSTDPVAYQLTTTSQMRTLLSAESSLGRSMAQLCAQLVAGNQGTGSHVMSSGGTLNLHACYLQSKDGLVDPAIVVSGLPLPPFIPSVPAHIASAPDAPPERSSQVKNMAVLDSPLPTADQGNAERSSSIAAQMSNEHRAIAAEFEESKSNTIPLDKQADMLRGHSLLSVVPCIVTLLKLPSSGLPGFGSSLLETLQESTPDINPCMHLGLGTRMPSVGGPSGATSSYLNQGRVVFQNEWSMQYYGQVAPTSGVSTMLTRLFIEDVELMDDMLQTVQKGQAWTQVLQVPIICDPSPDGGMTITRNTSFVSEYQQYTDTAVTNVPASLNGSVSSSHAIGHAHAGHDVRRSSFSHNRPVTNTLLSVPLRNSQRQLNTHGAPNGTNHGTSHHRSTSSKMLGVAVIERPSRGLPFGQIVSQLDLSNAYDTMVHRNSLPAACIPQGDNTSGQISAPSDPGQLVGPPHQLNLVALQSSANLRKSCSTSALLRMAELPASCVPVKSRSKVARPLETRRPRWTSQITSPFTGQPRNEQHNALHRTGTQERLGESTGMGPDFRQSLHLQDYASAKADLLGLVPTPLSSSTGQTSAQSKSLRGSVTTMTSHESSNTSLRGKALAAVTKGSEDASGMICNSQECTAADWGQLRPEGLYIQNLFQKNLSLLQGVTGSPGTKYDQLGRAPPHAVTSPMPGCLVGRGPRTRRASVPYVKNGPQLALMQQKFQNLLNASPEPPHPEQEGSSAHGDSVAVRGPASGQLCRLSPTKPAHRSSRASIVPDPSFHVSATSLVNNRNSFSLPSLLMPELLGFASLSNGGRISNRSSGTLPELKTEGMADESFTPKMTLGYSGLNKAAAHLGAPAPAQAHNHFTKGKEAWAASSQSISMILESGGASLSPSAEPSASAPPPASGTAAGYAIDAALGRTQQKPATETLTAVNPSYQSADSGSVFVSAPPGHTPTSSDESFQIASSNMGATSPCFVPAQAPKEQQQLASALAAIKSSDPTSTSIVGQGSLSVLSAATSHLHAVASPAAGANIASTGNLHAVASPAAGANITATGNLHAVASPAAGANIAATGNLHARASPAAGANIAATGNLHAVASPAAGANIAATGNLHAVASPAAGANIAATGNLHAGASPAAGANIAATGNLHAGARPKSATSATNERLSIASKDSGVNAGEGEDLVSPLEGDDTFTQQDSFGSMQIGHDTSTTFSEPGAYVSPVPRNRTKNAPYRNLSDGNLAFPGAEQASRAESLPFPEHSSDLHPRKSKDYHIPSSGRVYKRHSQSKLDGGRKSKGEYSPGNHVPWSPGRRANSIQVNALSQQAVRRSMQIERPSYNFGPDNGSGRQTMQDEGKAPTWQRKTHVMPAQPSARVISMLMAAEVDSPGRSSLTINRAGRPSIDISKQHVNRNSMNTNRIKLRSSTFPTPANDMPWTPSDFGAITRPDAPQQAFTGSSLFANSSSSLPTPSPQAPTSHAGHTRLLSNLQRSSPLNHELPSASATMSLPYVLQGTGERPSYEDKKSNDSISHPTPSTGVLATPEGLVAALSPGTTPPSNGFQDQRPSSEAPAHLPLSEAAKICAPSSPSSAPVPGRPVANTGPAYAISPPPSHSQSRVSSEMSAQMSAERSNKSASSAHCHPQPPPRFIKSFMPPQLGPASEQVGPTGDKLLQFPLAYRVSPSDSEGAWSHDMPGQTNTTEAKHDSAGSRMDGDKWVESTSRPSTPFMSLLNTMGTMDQTAYGSQLANTRNMGATEAQSWHEVSAIPMKDPVTGTDVILLLQTDITARTELEMRMAALTEVQLTMLEQMFPRHVLEFMLGPGSHATDQQGHLATSHSDVTILFMDIVGFTSMSKEVQPEKVMQYLNNLFTLFDVLVDNYKVYKVETAGDCYIVAGGLMRYDEEGFLAVDKAPDARTGALQAMEFAKAMLRCAKTVLMPHNNEPTKVRVGMHTGPVVTGLIGMKLPKFSVFGDTMNTASRMESTCRMGAIQVSELTGKLLGDTHTFEPTGGVEVKGKGMMNTFIWSPDKNPSENYSSLTKIEQDANALIKHSRKLSAPSNSGKQGDDQNLMPKADNLASLWQHSSYPNYNMGNPGDPGSLPNGRPSGAATMHPASLPGQHASSSRSPAALFKTISTMHSRNEDNTKFRNQQADLASRPRADFRSTNLVDIKNASSSSFISPESSNPETPHVADLVSLAMANANNREVPLMSLLLEGAASYQASRLPVRPSPTMPQGSSKLSSRTSDRCPSSSVPNFGRNSTAVGGPPPIRRRPGRSSTAAHLCSATTMHRLHHQCSNVSGGSQFSGHSVRASPSTEQ